MLDHKDFPPLPSHERAEEQKKGKEKRAIPVVKRNVGCAASILHLPDELILEILAYLPCLDQQDLQLSSLLSLSLTNRRLHALAVGKLYAAFDSLFGLPYPFLRTVVSDHQLADKVRSLTFKYPPAVRAERVPYRSSASDKKIIKEGLKVLEIPGWKAWASACNDSNAEQELLYATILMHTPNIVSLDIDDGFVRYKTPKWLDLIRWAVSGSPFGHIHQFSHLRSIRVDVLNLKPRHLCPLFKLQSLRKLKLIGLMEPGTAKVGKADYLRRLVPAASCPIDDFSLQESFINCEVLGVLLGFIRALERFEYQHADDRWLLRGDISEVYWSGSIEWQTTYGDPTTMLNYPTLMAALECHHHSLESLSIFEETEEPDIQEAPGFIESLRRFEKLTYLNVPLGALVNLERKTPQTLVEKLPRSLKMLGIFIRGYATEYRCMPAVEHMAAHCRDFLPFIEHVRIGAIDDSGSGYTYDWKRLLVPLSRLGVNLVVDEALKELYGSTPSLSDVSDIDADAEDTESDSDEESLHSL